MSTYSSLYPRPDFDCYFVAHLKDDAAKEPITVSESTLRAIADASAKTGRPRGDFEVEEIPESRYQKLKQFLGS